MSRWANLSPEAKAAYIQKQYKWRKANPEKAKEVNRKSERRRKLKTYGLTEATYSHLLTNQNGVCGICKEPNLNVRDYHVDHCHTTLKTRGILCHHCNLLLGNAKDNTTVLRNAIEYLERHHG